MDFEIRGPDRQESGSWSWRIGRIAGIGIYVHFTFVLLLAWAAFAGYRQEGNIADAGRALLYVVTLFLIVVLHELGHALAASRYGIATRDITLLPIGGIARLERMPTNPYQEIVVALAGPAVNVVIATSLYLGSAAQNLLPADASVSSYGNSFVDQMFWINVALAVFNLLPAFPMDGGRVLRALLHLKTTYVAATRAAARVGQFMAVVFAFVGFFSNPFLVAIAVFVWFGAAYEYAAVKARSMLESIPISPAIVTDIRTLSPDNSLTQAATLMLGSFQHDFPVLRNGSVVGILKRADLLRGISERGLETRVGDVMDRNVETSEPPEMLETALDRLRKQGGESIPVVRGGSLIGLITLENLRELLMIREASRASHARLRTF